MFFTRISEIKRKKSESYIGFDKSTSTLEERLQARLRRLSPYPFGSVEKGLEREALLPFPRVRRFGTHSETGSKFLLLFSIKSKGGMLCFAEKVPNGRTANVGEPFYFCASAPNQCEALLLFLAHTCANILPCPTGICTAAFPFYECLFCLFVYNFNGILTGKNIEFFGQSHIIK